MDKHWDAIISGLFGLVGVFVGFFLERISNWLSERKKFKEEFAEIKNSIYATTITNNLISQLLLLKQFYIRHCDLLKKTGNNNFYQKWLTEPLVEEAFQGIGYWTSDKVKEMNNDLDKTLL
jgi:hypothetical protein